MASREEYTALHVIGYGYDKRSPEILKEFFETVGPVAEVVAKGKLDYIYIMAKCAIAASLPLRSSHFPFPSPPGKYSFIMMTSHADAAAAKKQLDGKKVCGKPIRSVDVLTF